MRLIKMFIFSLGICIATTGILEAQEENSIDNFLGIGFQYGFDFPIADLGDRFGRSNHVSISIDFYNQKWNGFYGFESSFQFGDRVKEDVLAPLRSSSSNALLGFNGAPSSIFLRRRGLYTGVYINKNILSSKKNPANGINVGLGLGILEHKVRIQDDTNSARQLDGDYIKGYDRLTRGPALKQTIYYQGLSTNKAVNFLIGLSFIEGFTDSVRAINFDTQSSAREKRLDVLVSLEAKWIIPLTRGRSSEDIYY